MTVFELLWKWQDNIVADKVGWARDVNKITDPKLLEAYEAGLRQGMTSLRAALRLHGMLNEEAVRP